MENKQDLVEIGKITKPHALKGELRAFIGTSTDLKDKYVIIKEQKHKIERFVLKTDNLALLKLSKITCVEQAEELRNQKIFIDINDLADDEFSIDQLKKLDLIDFESDKKIGKVLNIINMPASPVLEIKLEENGEIFLVPFVLDTYVKKISKEDKKMYLKDWKLFL